jgi:hypothetical protein
MIFYIKNDQNLFLKLIIPFWKKLKKLILRVFTYIVAIYFVAFSILRS